MSVQPTTDAPGFAIVTLTNVHAHIHDGEGFKATVYNAALGAGESLYLQMNMPASGYAHLKGIYLYTTGDLATFSITEDPTHTTGDAAVSAINRNRASSNVSGLTLFSNPTGISGGTLLDQFAIGSGGKQSGGEGNDEIEWILVADSVYILRLLNGSGQAEAMYIRANWYE